MYNELMKQYGVNSVDELISIFGSKENLDANIAKNSVDLGGTTDSVYSKYKTINNPTNTNFDSITGGNELMSADGAFGGVDNGNSYSGWVSPTLQVGSGIANAYMGYQNFREAEKNNERNYKLSMEDARRKKIQYDNLITEKNRKTALAMGNSNNQYQTASIVRQNPYSRY